MTAAANEQSFEVEATVALMLTGRDSPDRGDGHDCICCPGPHCFARRLLVAEDEKAQDWLWDRLGEMWREHHYDLEGRRVRLTMELLPEEAI